MKRTALIATVVAFGAAAGSAQAMNRATPHRPARAHAHKTSTYVQQYQQSRAPQPGHVYVQ